VAELVVLEHTAGAGASAFTEVLDARTSIAPWRRVDVPGGDPLPHDLDTVAGLLVMGGTMSATTPDDLPWMVDELALLAEAVAADVPVFGVCLGAQLLGTALGGVVTRRERPQVGFLPVERTPTATDDPVFGGWPDGAAPLFVHEDEVTTLPAAAVPLLVGDGRVGDGDVPGWRLGSAWAVQFHPEVDAPQLERWVSHAALAPLLGAAGVDGEALLEEGRRRERFTVPLGRALLGRFLDAVVRPRVA
jgi:GMP synthase (glutamine-hydrolysing)